MSSKVGFWWSEKKSQKISVTELEALFKEKGFQLIKIDLKSPIEPQGPFVAIIHKLSDIVVKAEQSDESALQQITLFEDYVNKHPEVIILDPLENVRKLLDRYRQYKLIDDSELAREDGVFTPTFVELTTTDVSENIEKLKNAFVRFPFVCKPLLAHGSTYAHQMSLIFSESGLKTISPPCVAQTFINHNARLFKLFLIKDKYYVIERPSLKNFKAGTVDCETVHFDSHDISKPNSSSVLTELDENDEKRYPIREPEKERLDRIVKVVSDKLGLSLLGIDVIIENKTGRYAIIDMNAFPGYDGVDNFLEMLRDLVIEEIESRNNTIELSNETSARISNTESCLSKHSVVESETVCNQELKPPVIAIINEGNLSDIKASTDEKAVIEKLQNGNDIDSGIDTSDSCDEKKNKKQSQVKVVRRQHSRSFTTYSNVKLGDYNSI
jgi:inositol-1,3,4-trisphosphate 5/6-kinase/inositol-tetrakisphosphate 1-kinase